MSNSQVSSKKLSKNKWDTLTLTQMGVLSGIILLMHIIPVIGYIPTPAASLTIIHIPVIIGAVVLGPMNGAILGGVFGVTCMIKAFVAPPGPFDAIFFTNPIISVVPRILFGLIAGYVFILIAKIDKSKIIAAGVAAFAGSAANTFFVLLGVYLWHDNMALVGINPNDALPVLWGIVTGQGIFEALIAVVVTIAISKTLFVFLKRSRYS